MSTELTTNVLSVHNATDLIPAVTAYGEMICKGGLYGCKNAQQGQTLVLMAMSEGVPITQLRKMYHIIGGSDLAMRADWMLAEFRRIGGWYQWIDQGDDGQKATLHIKFKENDMHVSYTIDMAKRAGLCKPKSGWEKNPGEMLRSRCQTKAIRMVAPEVIAGFATDEEVGETYIESTEVGSSGAVSPSVPTSQSVAPVASGSADDDAEDAEYVVADTVDPNLATPEQMQQVRDLFESLNVGPEAQLKAMKKRGCADMGCLTKDAAADMIASMTALIEKHAEEATGESRIPEGATGIKDDGPVSTAEIDQIKSLLREAAQLEGQANVTTKIKEKLQASGMQKIADLNATEAKALIQSLTVGNLETFFDLQLEGTAKND